MEQDVGLTEDQMLAQAIAMSLVPTTPQSVQASTSVGSSTAAVRVPTRSITTQSSDSALSVDSFQRGGQQLRQSSQGTMN